MADDHNWMRIVANVFAGLEAAPKHGMNADRVEIVRRDNASRNDFGVISNVYRAAVNRGDKRIVAERAIPAQVLEVRPGKKVSPILSLYRSADGEQPVLMRDERVRAEENS